MRLSLFLYFTLLLTMSVAANSVVVRRVGIIGGGLSGLSAALEASRTLTSLRETSVCEIIVFDKEPKLGGNSMKASSGFNAITETAGPEFDTFLSDTRLSGGGLSKEILIRTLVAHSPAAKAFLESFGVDLSGTTRLGGHSKSRTRFNPAGANIGFSIMKQLMSAVETDPNIKVIKSAKVTRIEPRHENNDPSFIIHYTNDVMEVNSVVIATGGFGANKAMLEHYAKEASVYATTNGPWSTGDGLELGKGLGAEWVHLEQVQVHPTGFVDLKDPDAGSKVLAAEKLRGCGAIMLNMEGRRFVDELNRRDHVFNKLSQQTGERAWLLLSAAGGEKYNVTHMGFYMGRGLITKVDSITTLAQHMNIDEEIVREELTKYNDACTSQNDVLGKTTFPTAFDLDRHFFVAMITPVVHYCMGGLAFNENGEVLSPDGAAIPGVYAAGEVTGGLHGQNRLGGNSLLDCVVFGRQAGAHAIRSLAQVSTHEEL